MAILVITARWPFESLLLLGHFSHYCPSLNVVGSKRIGHFPPCRVQTILVRVAEYPPKTEMSMPRMAAQRPTSASGRVPGADMWGLGGQQPFFLKNILDLGALLGCLFHYADLGFAEPWRVWFRSARGSYVRVQVTITRQSCQHWTKK